MEDILAALLIAVGFNLWMFLPAYFFKTDCLTDISYATSFLVVSAYSFTEHVTNLDALAFLMIFVWAIRLGTYLFLRIIKMKADDRFNNIRQSFIKFFAFWLLQGVTVFIVLLPSIFLFKRADSELGHASIGGLVIYVLGMMMEAVADHQKYTFKKDLANKGKFIQTGLWKYSRHPNYLGEILVWTGIYLFALPHLTYPYNIIGALSPLYIFCMLVFVSGVPLLERSADKKWGKDPAYQAYKQKTRVLIPFLW